MKMETAQRIVAITRCYDCEAPVGDHCRTRTGNPCSPHVLRINAAKRDTARINELCPLGCGDVLMIGRRPGDRYDMILHDTSLTWDCA